MAAVVAGHTGPIDQSRAAAVAQQQNPRAGHGPALFLSPDAPLLLGWCLMPNHWHLLLLPKPSRQGQSQSNLSTWMQWLTVTHTHRWHQQYHDVGLPSAVPGAVQELSDPD